MVGIRSGGHALENARLVEVFAEEAAAILTAPIAVKDEARFRAPGTKVDHHGQIEPAGRGGDKGDVTGPRLIRADGKPGLEEAVGRRAISPAVTGLGNISFWLERPESPLCHDPAYPGRRADNVRFVEIVPDPPVVVASAMAVKDLLDSLADFMIGEFGRRRRGGMVVAAPRRAQNRADRVDAVPGFAVNPVDHFEKP